MREIQVAAGVIWRQGRVLICKRGAGRLHAHLWEFPGGKLEAGETPQACLERELREELRIAVRPDCLLHEGEEALPRGDRLHFYFVQGTLAQGQPVLTEHEEARWVRPEELAGYSFCPADEAFARSLSAQPRVTHFFWDFDGTLMDTYPAVARAYQLGLAELGRRAPLDEVMGAVKISLEAASRLYHDRWDLSPEELMAQYRRFEPELTPASKPLPGMAEALAALHGAGAHHYVYTHRGRIAMHYLAAVMDTSLFEDVVSSEDGFPLKPDPTALEAMLARNRVPPAAAMMVGDRDIDVEAGLNAGIAGCLIDPQGYYAAYDAPFRVGSFAALQERFWPGP